MIADRLGPMHMSANRTYEMQRTNHFEVVFENISSDVTLCVDSAGALNTSIEPVELAYGNSKVKVAGQVTYEDFELVVKDAIVADIEAQLYDWFKQVYDVENDKMGWAYKYKRTGRLYQYAPDGSLSRVWKLVGCWPTNFQTSEFSYDGSDKKTITMTISVDKAYPIRS